MCSYCRSTEVVAVCLLFCEMKLKVNCTVMKVERRFIVCYSYQLQGIYAIQTLVWGGMVTWSGHMAWVYTPCLVE